MKFLVVALAFVAVASALPAIRPTAVSESMQQIQQIIDAINSPSTDPNTAIALEAMLQDLIGGVSVGPAPVGGNEPISIAPVFVDVGGNEPISIAPVFVDVSPAEPVAVAPVVVAPVADASASSSAPLVQIILNINAAAAGAVETIVPETPAAEAVVDAVSPVIVVEQPAPEPTPVIVVEQPAPEPTPVMVVEQPAVPEVVAVVELPESVAVGTPVLPTPVLPVVTLPEILN